MEFYTISRISDYFNLSTHALRYYERTGLIQSENKDDCAGRLYSEDTVKRIGQIAALRRLRIPLEQISKILQSEDAAAVIETFLENLGEIDGAMPELSTIRGVISDFITRLNESASCDIRLKPLDDAELLEAVDSLTIQQTRLKEGKTAADLQAASEKSYRLSDRDVRIVYLPPATVASVYAQGDAPELVTDELVQKFIKETKLETVYPASRHYGFNRPDEPVHGHEHGYERYLTIPEAMEVPPPFVKKRFQGGVYAGVTIPMGDWYVWMKLHEWVCGSERYDFRWGTIDGVCGWIEEHLNYWNWYADGADMEDNDKNKQIELLIPIQAK